MIISLDHKLLLSRIYLTFVGLLLGVELGRAVGLVVGFLLGESDGP